MKCNRTLQNNIHLHITKESILLGKRAEKLKTVTINKHSRYIYSFFKYFSPKVLHRASMDEKNISQLIIDFKNKSESAIDEFMECIKESMEDAEELFQPPHICLLRVPSSEAKITNGFDILIEKISNQKGYINGSDIIKRHTSREKKHLTPGRRTPDIDFDTLEISNHMLEETKDCKKFYIFDDVTVSGASLLVCSYLLSKSKYVASKTIYLRALGKNESIYD